VARSQDVRRLSFKRGLRRLESDCVAGHVGLRVAATADLRRLWDTYSFPGFRPQQTVRAVFGDPQGWLPAGWLAFAGRVCRRYVDFALAIRAHRDAQLEAGSGGGARYLGSGPCLCSLQRVARSLYTQPDESLRFDDQAAQRAPPVVLAH
jgi:hypothetical protein